MLNEPRTRCDATSRAFPRSLERKKMRDSTTKCSVPIVLSTRSQADRRCRHRGPSAPVEVAVRDHRRRLQEAVHDERPRRAVPQADQEHRQPEVEVRAHRRAARCRRAGNTDSRAATSTASCASAARTRPGSSTGTGDRSSPAASAEQHRRAARDVGVAGEVAVDLQRVRVQREHDLAAPCTPTDRRTRDRPG